MTEERKPAPPRCRPLPPSVVAEVADGSYEHNVNLGDGNGHAHVRAGLVGPSLTIPFVDGRLTLGRYQDIVFCDFDTRPRARRLVVQVMGV